jgi:ABC-2 type transport system ATP-binding protein
MIQVSSLSKSFGKHEVLKDISFELKPGKIYGLVGENGAGKTTLFRCMSGLEKHSGTIQSNFDQPLKNVTGYLPAELYFLPFITGEEHLELLIRARNKSTETTKTHNVFNLPLQQFASEYSTGMQKKLALTGILLQENQLFILDEPFNGVDIQSNQLIVEILSLLKSKGKTIILSSHIFSTLHDVCDTLFHLRDGKIVQTAEKADFSIIERDILQHDIRDRIQGLDWK